jgi:hypothetical protein
MFYWHRRAPLLEACKPPGAVVQWVQWVQCWPQPP